jgi:glycosyltransferase involved in cell wall biosynthesis
MKPKNSTPLPITQTPPPTKKVAIVHDWLVGGGAEKVVLAMHEMFPDAPIYTSYCTPYWRKKLDGKVITGYLQKWPFSKLRKFLPILRIHWFEHLDLQEFDVVISSSGNGEAKGVKKLKTGATHICYCHSPTHFYWDKYDEYLKSPGFGLFDPLARFGLKTLVGPLRKWDLKASKRANYYIANSNHIQNMIKKYYDRDSVVIHPPVDVDRFTPLPSSQPPVPKKGFITVGRQTPYKKTDIIVKACADLHAPLKVIGYGPEHSKLVKMAGPNVSFIEKASDKDIENALASAQAFLFVAYEDFGIVPVEAMAAGTPLIAYKAGGALDYVNSKTGIFFEEQTVDSLKNALQKFDSAQYKQSDLIKQAELFGKQVFKDKLLKFLEEKCAF